MRRKKTVLLLVSLLAFCIVLGAGWKKEADENKKKEVSDLGLIFVQEDVLTGKEKKASDRNPGICYEQVLLPYDAETNRVYLSQPCENTEWMGALSGDKESYILYARQDAYWEQKQAAIQENHLFTLWLVGEADYYEVQLVITGMPVMSVVTESEEEPEPVEYEVDPEKFAYGSETLYLGTMNLFNPCVGTEEYEIVQTGVTYHEKGISSKSFEKKGYALKLTDSKQEKVDVSLLGMRSDNSWKLNALNTDANLIREKTAAQIWEKIDEANPELNEAGPRMEYVEVVLDNEYQGVYCLVEPVDEKKLELDRNDVLYKVIAWDAPTLEAIQESIDRGWKVQFPIRIRYPEVVSNYEEVWYPMKEYISIFYYPADIDLARAEAIVNVDNFADVFMFLMVTSASDNYFKNLYFAARVDSFGEYQMYQIPWDLDYTFGNTFMAYVDRNVAFNTDYTLVYAETSLPRLKSAGTEFLEGALLERWQSYRQDFLRTDSVIALLEENRDYLIETGAILREQERWPEAGVNTDIEELITYQEKRMEWLDEYFKEWVQ